MCLVAVHSQDGYLDETSGIAAHVDTYASIQQHVHLDVEGHV